MKKLMVSVVMSGVAGTLALVACGSSKSSDPAPTPTATATTVGSNTTGATTYASVSTYLTATCAKAGCHDSSTKASGIDLTTQAGAAAHAAKAASEIKDGSMPLGGSSIFASTDGKKLYDWFAAGAPN